MNTRRIAGISIFAAMASVSMGVVIAQDSRSPTAPDNASAAGGEIFQQKWASFIRASTGGAELRELIQSLEEFLISPPENAADLEKWRRAMSDFQDTSDGFISLVNEAYAERAAQGAESAVAE
jgi:chemotaxis regulatin CheY-phosphate phosphatase CheZ